MNPPSYEFAVIVACHVLLGAALGGRVIFIRIRDRVGIGDGHNKSLQRAIRAHGNFAEWVPLALLTLGVADLRGASTTTVMAIGGVMLLGRVMHGFGLSRWAGAGIGRTGGMTIFLFAMLAAAGFAVFPGG